MRRFGRFSGAARPIALAAGITAAALARGAASFAGDDAAPPAAKDAKAWMGELKSGDVEGRRKAAYGLWSLGPAAKDAIVALAAALRDDDEYVRTTADRVLTALVKGSPGMALWPAVPELVTGLTDPRLPVRRLAAGALWRSGWPSGAPPPGLGVALAKVLDDEDVPLRALAASIAANFGPWVKEARPALLRRAKDADKDVRLWSVQALGAMGGAETLDVCIAALTDEDARVRAAAAGAFRSGGPARRGAVPALVKALDDSDATVRQAAMGAFATMSGDVAAPEAVPRLIQSLEAEQPILRMLAASALGQLGDVRALEPLSHRASDDVDATVRGQALRALCALGPEGAESLDVLISALGDSNAMVASSAAGALGQLGPLAADAEEALRRAARHTDPMVRQSAFSALWRIGPLSAESRALIASGLDDPVGMVRVQAAAGVADLGFDAVPLVPALARLLAHPEGAEERYTALLALARIGPRAKEAADAVRALKPKDLEAAARAFALVGIAATPDDAAEGMREFVRLVGGDAKEEAGPAAFALSFLPELGEAARPALAALALKFVTAEGSSWTPAADALIAIDGPKALAPIERLRSAALAGDWWALTVLAKRLPADPETRRILFDRLASDAPRERAAAVEGLGGLAPSLHSEEVAARIRMARSDPSGAVRMAAALALRRLGLEVR